MRCQCEHESHTKACNNEGHFIRKTIYGTYLICSSCNSKHPIPKEFLKKVSRSENIKEFDYNKLARRNKRGEYLCQGKITVHGYWGRNNWTIPCNKKVFGGPKREDHYCDKHKHR
jgi:hypothetical protein